MDACHAQEGLHAHLPWTGEGKPVRLIAIGGDKLSRGLTLDGLCTSYFVRTTKMYDTLMQMGRWFGYRPGYVDLCRLYTTVDLVDWFGHIADAAEELREEFDAMAASGGTPRDYGLKVQSHKVLLVTSPLKMRNAKSLQLSFSGDLLETAVEQCLLFLTMCAEGKMAAKLEPSSDVRSLAETLQAIYDDLEQVRVFVLTDQVAKSKSFKTRDIAGKAVRLEVMDIERLHRHWSEGKPRDELVVDFTEVSGAPLPCV